MPVLPGVDADGVDLGIFDPQILVVVLRPARLGAAGVIAAPVHDGREVASDPALRARGAIEPVRHPEAGEWPQAVIPWHYSRLENPAIRPAPRLGEHSAEVLAELLGMPREHYEALAAAGVSGEGPP